MLTVRESMGLHPIDRGKVVAGFDGLDNVIESATVLEIPDAVEFLESNLLALTSLYAITDDEDKQLEVIKLLIEHGISALMIFNIGRENGLLKLPQSVIDACDESNLPLIVMPLDVSYYSVLVAVIDKLMNGQAKKLQNTIEIYETYTDQLFDNAKDYAALVNTPVSYTHLDVYKRQEKYCMVSAIKRLTTPVSYTHLAMALAFPVWDAGSSVGVLSAVSLMILSRLPFVPFLPPDESGSV